MESVNLTLVVPPLCMPFPVVSSVAVVSGPAGSNDAGLGNPLEQAPAELRAHRIDPVNVVDQQGEWLVIVCKCLTSIAGPQAVLNSSEQ